MSYTSIVMFEKAENDPFWIIAHGQRTMGEKFVEGRNLLFERTGVAADANPYGRALQGFCLEAELSRRKRLLGGKSVSR